MDSEKEIIKISVRDLVEFIVKTGNLDNTSGQGRDVSIMQQGSALHKKIQKSMPAMYRAEVSLANTLDFSRENIEFQLNVHGRADGIFKTKLIKGKSRDNYKFSPKALDNKEKDFETEEILEGIISEDMISESMISEDTISERMISERMISEDTISESIASEDTALEGITLEIIDEIKCFLKDISHIKKPYQTHLAQAMCYAYILLKDNNYEYVGVRMTYCHIETEEVRYFDYIYSGEYLEEWYQALVNEYAKWACFQIKWREKRNISIRELKFPFEYRKGQKELAAGVYRTIIRKKKLYIQAPTGVGKTISTVFPAVKAIGEKQAEKIFYLTAKTITRTAAEKTFKILKDKKLDFKFVTLTSKEKICILEKPKCNPANCERALGHFDRINDAVFDVINNENEITREVIEKYARKHNVCPFEMSLDVSIWTDAIICDYNYVFDPNVYLRRFFEIERESEYVFLIDEAHNLVERACEMYSAKITLKDFKNIKKLIKDKSKKLAKHITVCQRELEEFKRETEDYCVYYNIDVVSKLYLYLMRFMSGCEDLWDDYPDFEGKEDVLDVYFKARHFVNMYENADSDYIIYTNCEKQGDFSMQLRCMNPAENLKYIMKKAKSSIMFSATFLPINYYKEQLAGNEDDYAVYANSTFDPKKRLLMLANDVSTKYTRRNQSEYQKIARYIESFTKAKKGNYWVFFPSYSYMDTIFDYMPEEMQDKIFIQQTIMSEEQREEFLELFEENPEDTNIGFCVLGGIFGEGIDLKNDRLIGVAIVGTGLPMVCSEREIYKNYYDENEKNGFDYAYLYNGMNKVLQAAGRVIRTNEDVGAILLLDERFQNVSYRRLFPREWADCKVVNLDSMEKVLTEFWEENI